MLNTIFSREISDRACPLAANARPFWNNNPYLTNLRAKLYLEIQRCFSVIYLTSETTIADADFSHIWYILHKPQCHTLKLMGKCGCQRGVILSTGEGNSAGRDHVLNMLWRVFRFLLRASCWWLSERQWYPQYVGNRDSAIVVLF